MSGEREQGSFKTDIPEDAIADAVAAVEKHAAVPAEPGIVVDGAPDAAAQREQELRAQLAEEHDLRLRALADLDNFRKRVAREREQVQRAGAEQLMRDLLPVLDNMERALSALPEGPLATGVSMTQRHLEETLKRHGLRPFTASSGTVFDPRIHEAITTVPSAEHAAGTVVAQELRGYFLNDRLLRPASVVVASAPPVAVAATATEPGGADPGAPGEEHGA